MSIGWWNIEGARHVLGTAPDSDPLSGADVWFLGETFATAPTTINNFKTHEQLAVQRERGRPSGGLLAGFRGSAKMDLISVSPEHLHCRLRGIHILGFYYAPDHSIENIVEQTASAIGEAAHGPIVVTGDLQLQD